MRSVNGDGTAGDVPAWSGRSVSNNTYMWIGRVKVAPTTSGNDNYINLPSTWSTTGVSAITQVSLIIRMTNASFAQSSTVALPSYVNNVNVVTSPY